MKILEEALTEIFRLHKQVADIRDQIEQTEEKYGIGCRYCRIYSISCNKWGRFPACFQPDEAWREKYEKCV